MGRETVRDERYDQIIFIGETLGPLFLQEPAKGSANKIFDAFSKLAPDEASNDWPFVDRSTAQNALELMVNGLKKGIDDEDLAWEYRRLFVGPARKPVPPWGSVYTDRECVVFGESTLALRQWMRDNGIERTTDDQTPEDHIGLMLLLLAWIAENKPDLVEAYLKDHMLTWSSHFLDQLTEAAEEPFYEGLALLTKETLEGIQAELKIEVAYPKYFR